VKQPADRVPLPSQETCRKAYAGRRVERFRHEARAIGRITHPNICTLHDVGEDGSSIFLVMEYVDGATLASRLWDGPLPLALALRNAVQISVAAWFIVKARFGG